MRERTYLSLFYFVDDERFDTYKLQFITKIVYTIIVTLILDIVIMNEYTVYIIGNSNGLLTLLIILLLVTVRLIITTNIIPQIILRLYSLLSLISYLFKNNIKWNIGKSGYNYELLPAVVSLKKCYTTFSSKNRPKGYKYSLHFTVVVFFSLLISITLVILQNNIALFIFGIFYKLILLLFPLLGNPSGFTLILDALEQKKEYKEQIKRDTD